MPARSIEIRAPTAHDDGMESFLGPIVERLLDPTLLVAVALLSVALLSGLVGRLAQFGADRREDRRRTRPDRSAEPYTSEVSR